MQALQPTFYELLAVQKLHESLRRAFKYCLGVAAHRHPQVVSTTRLMCSVCSLTRQYF